MGLAYTFVEALQRAGANPTRQSIVHAIEKGGLTGPGLVPFRYSKDSHAGYTGAQIGEIKNGETAVTGQAADHRRRRRRHHGVDDERNARAGQRRAAELVAGAATGGVSRTRPAPPDRPRARPAGGPARPCCA